MKIIKEDLFRANNELQKCIYNLISEIISKNNNEIVVGIKFLKTIKELSLKAIVDYENESHSTLDKTTNIIKSKLITK